MVGRLEVVGDLDLLVLLDDGVELGAPGVNALNDLLRRLGSEAPVVSFVSTCLSPSLFCVARVPSSAQNSKQDVVAGRKGEQRIWAGREVMVVTHLKSV